MDNNKLMNFVRDGRLHSNNKLPPGLRFQPTDEELVFQYLAPKIFSSPTNCTTIIPQIHNIFSFHPSHLPGETSDKYFFSNKEEWNIGNGNYRRRGIVRGGYWRVIGLDKQIVISCWNNKRIVGIKRTLVFYQKKNNNSNSCSLFTRTHPFMHLYCIAGMLPRNPTNYIQQKKLSLSSHHHQLLQVSDHHCLVEIGKWDLCHIFMKKRMSSTSDEQAVYDDDHKYGTRLVIRNNFVTVEESDSSSSSSYHSDSTTVPRRTELSSTSTSVNTETK